MQSKQHIRQRAKHVGVWDKFRKHRDALKRTGYKPESAWKKAVDDILVPAEKLHAERVIGGDLPDASTVAAEVQLGAFVAEKGAPREVAEWVARFLEVEVVDPGECPCPEAWNLRAWARSSDDNKKTFWVQVYTKIMPTKAELAEANRNEDDGREFDKRLDEIERFMREAQEAS